MDLVEDALQFDSHQEQLISLPQQVAAAAHGVSVEPEEEAHRASH